MNTATDTTAAAQSILIIDDEPQIQRLLSIALKTDGYRISTAATGEEGLATAARDRFDAIILDLGLPDMEGMEVLKRLRAWTQTPVIILTVNDSPVDKVEALDCGANDYVTKPFDTGELQARLRVALRLKDKSQVEQPVFKFGDLEVNLAARRVTCKGQPVKLTVTEYDLLRMFIQHAGKVLTHQQILREVWGPKHEKQTQYLRVYMARLREKLEPDPAAPPLFQTESGVGYRMLAD